MASSSGAIEKAAKALATAGGVAHVAFFSLFAFRVVSSGLAGKALNLLFAALALVGLASEVVGYSLIRYGGKTRVRKYGLYAIALSTGLAAILLAAASWTG
jgi:hypothetical protein